MTSTIPAESTSLSDDLATALDPNAWAGAVDNDAPDVALVQRVPIALIDDNPDNPRDDVGDVSELAQSIAQGGLLQPVLLVPKPVWRAGNDHMPDEHDDGRFVLIHGHRRRAAHQLLDLEHIEAIVRDRYVGAGGQIAMIVENFHRADLNPVQEAKAFSKLRELGLEQDVIAERVGCSQSHVSKRLGLLELPAETQALVVDKTLTFADALDLRPLADDPKALAIAITRRNGHGGVKSAVEEALQAQVAKDAVRRTTEDLKAQGIRVVKAPEYFTYSGKVQKLDALVREGATSKAKHAKLPCHATAVYQKDAWGGQKAGGTVLVCTDAKSHPTKHERDRDAAAAAREEQQAHAKVAHAERLTFLTGLLRKPPKDAVDYLLNALSDQIRLDTNLTAELCEVLGLADETRALDKDALSDFLVEFENKSSTNRLRAVLASQLLLEEESLQAQHGGRWGRHEHRTDEYAAFLRDHGYTGDEVATGSESAGDE